MASFSPFSPSAYFLAQEANIPLFAAVEAGNLNVCRELLGQDTLSQIRYVKEPLKDTALHLAGRKRDNDMVKMFIEAGAIVDAKNVRRPLWGFEYCLYPRLKGKPCCTWRRRTATKT